MMFLAAILIHATAPASARYTCADVRAAVATVGEDEVERRARAGGATDGLIAEARKCLRRHKRD